MDITEQEKAKRAMAESSEWLVRKGVALSLTEGPAAAGKYLAKEWGAQMWVAPRIADGRFLALFRTKFRGIKHQVICVSRSEGAIVKELWIIKEFAEEWAGGGDSCRFVLTEAASLKEDRKILSFFALFNKDAAQKISAVFHLENTDPMLVYDLEPYRYPKEYAGSKFEGLHSEADGNGGYRFVTGMKADTPKFDK